MIRRIILRLLMGLLLIPGGPGSQARAAADRPNVVFILIDDLRWNALSCMNHPFVKTPNIDRIAHLAEYFHEPQYPRIPSWQAARTERWKYIHYTELEGMDELYDLKADPGEMKNLINEPGAQATLKEMKLELWRLLEETHGS